MTILRVKKQTNKQTKEKKTQGIEHTLTKDFSRVAININLIYRDNEWNSIWMSMQFSIGTVRIPIYNSLIYRIIILSVHISQYKT